LAKETVAFLAWRSILDDSTIDVQNLHFRAFAPFTSRRALGEISSHFGNVHASAVIARRLRRHYPALPRMTALPHAPAPAFPNVVGHSLATEMIVRALRRDKLHHGLLFFGPRGVGKATLARGLGCALLCPVLVHQGCGTCDTCVRILQDRHSDVVFAKPSGKNQTIKRETIQELVIRSLHAPYEGTSHLIVIDPADQIGEEGANVLLKTLEEPTPGVRFVLIATNLEKVLATLRSRTLAIPIGRLDDESVRSIAQQQLASEQDDDESTDFTRTELAIALAEGSPGAAISLLRDPSIQATRQLLVQAIEAGRVGPSGVFSGDSSPLWVAFNQAVAQAEEPSENKNDDDENVITVVSKSGKRSKAEKTAKPKKSAPTKAAEGEDSPGESESGGKASPARQRLALYRLCDLWLLLLREAVRERHTLNDLPDLRSLGIPRLIGQMRLIDRLSQQLDANANARLAFEVLLLQIHPLLRRLGAPAS
jgi:DNA polymerase-3 subunit delta'